MSQFNVIPLIVNNVNNGIVQCPGGIVILSAQASVFPTSVTLQILMPDGATYLAPTGTQLTANGIIQFTIPQTKVQAVVVGSPTALYCNLYLVPTNLN